MKSQRGNRMRRTLVLTAAVAAVAALALAGLASARGHHGERHRHGPDTGTIASFDSGTGVLGIQLTGGDTVTGLVTRRTEIRCEDQSSLPSRIRGREGESGGGSDNSGPGRGGESGDDNGGRGEVEPGDDHGGQGEVEPGDDHGQGVEPGDDNGHGIEPGDDNGHGVEPGDDNGGRGPSGHDDNGVGANCTSADLSVGATVHEAELDLRGGKAVWDEVELAPTH